MRVCLLVGRRDPETRERRLTIARGAEEFHRKCDAAQPKTSLCWQCKRCTHASHRGRVAARRRQRNDPITGHFPPFLPGLKSGVSRKTGTSAVYSAGSSKSLWLRALCTQLDGNRPDADRSLI